MNLSVLKAEIARIRSEQSYTTWLVVKPGTKIIYYEAVSAIDATTNCPVGYELVECTDEQLEAYSSM